MKTKSNNNLFFWITIIVSFVAFSTFINSCKPTNTCDNPNGYSLHFPLSNTDDTLLIPYKGYETLKFLRMTPSDTDTVVFQGMGKNYYVNEEYIGGLDCPETHFYEGFRIDFINQDSSKYPSSIQLSIEMRNMSSTLINIQIIDKNFNHLTKYVINEPSYDGYIGTINFNNQNFYRVSYITEDYNQNSEKVYLNLLNGIIRFELETFVLQLIK
jgi:hypothetical protein